MGDKAKRYKITGGTLGFDWNNFLDNVRYSNVTIESITTDKGKKLNVNVTPVFDRSGNIKSFSVEKIYEAIKGYYSYRNISNGDLCLCEATIQGKLDEFHMARWESFGYIVKQC